MNFWGKVGAILLVICLILFAWCYLTGGILLAFLDQDFNEASPLTVYQYWYYYQEESYIMDRLGWSAGISALVILVPLIAFLIPSTRSLYGDARFAKFSEVKKSGLLDGEGIIVGKLKDKYLQLKGQLHVILSAPTRSGKGVGAVIPNLLSWAYSVVVLDIKQENWDTTSEYRSKHGQDCFLFNPLTTDYRTHRYNPLSYISDNPDFMINDIQKIANMLFPDKPNTDVIWTATPRSFFLGVVLYLIETGGQLTIGQVLRESLNGGDGSKYFKNAILELAETDKPLSGDCVRALNSYISIASENTRAGIITGFRSQLELWMNPIVDAATSGNDFDLRRLRKDKISIYVGVTPDNLERVAPLLNLFFQQLIDLNTRELPHQDKEIKHDCLLLMDEFTAIGKIGVLSKGISYIAGYGLRMLPIIQSPSQLVDVYGQEAADTFTVNHALNIVFPPKATETKNARDISEWLGYQTVDGVSTSKSKALFKNRDPSENVSDQRRALLLPQEITSLDSEKEIVVMENLPPIMATKIRYYKDENFLNRLISVAPSLQNKSMSQVRKLLRPVIASGELAAAVPTLKLAKNDAVDIEQIKAMDAVETTERDITAEDIPSLASKSLSDFSINFPTLEIKDGINMSDDEILEIADRLSEEVGFITEENAVEEDKDAIDE